MLKFRCFFLYNCSAISDFITQDPKYVAIVVFLLQYMVAGTWKKSVDVAIRITNEKAINEDGLRFLEEAINISKYVQSAHCSYKGCMHVSNHFCNSFPVVESFSMKTFSSCMVSARKKGQFFTLLQNC